MAKNKEEDFLGWNEELKKWQQSDLDMRETARESDHFLLDKDGQWEEHICRQLDSQKRPRYTFDKITPVIETMMSDIEDMEFGCNVKPAGGDATKDLALTYEGMIRTIQNQSRSDRIFRNVVRRLMRRGFDACIVKAKFKDEWSFEQDLFIQSIPNAINRVWVSDTCTEEDSSDSPAAYVLTSMSKEAYKEKFPKGSCVSVDDSNMDEDYSDYQPEVITIAERYYKKEVEVEIAQLTNGEVVELNDKFLSIQDELALQGITIARQKKIKDFKWYHCSFDGGGVLTEERETVFRSCPVVTFYGNYEHLGESSKITYSGITQKEMDAQRVHNYAKSREIEEGALAPRAKYWMTKGMAKGHTAQLARMNVSADPVQFFNIDESAPGMFPQYAGGPQINPHLSNLGAQMAVDIKEQANVFSAMQGDFSARMSEETVRMQVDRGTAATRKWVNPLINGIRQICEILVETIPVVYDTKRQYAITSQDGTEEFVTLNDEVFDSQTQRMVRVNNLNSGKYKVVCDAGPAFANRLEAGLDALLKYAALDPTVIAQGGDVMLKAIDAPLVDQIAERKRAAMFQQGMIPVSQMTDEEKAITEQQAQQPKEPDAMTIAAQAEMMKAQADNLEVQRKFNKDAADAQIATGKLEIEAYKAQTDRAEQEVDAYQAGVSVSKTLSEKEAIDIDNQITAVTAIQSQLQPRV